MTTMAHDVTETMAFVSRVEEIKAALFDAFNELDGMTGLTDEGEAAWSDADQALRRLIDAESEWARSQ